MSKNTWLNVTLGILGFYFAFSVFDTEKYGIEVYAMQVPVSASNYWLLYCAIALLFACILVIVFCKPRSPLMTAIAVALGFVAVHWNKLCEPLANINRTLHLEVLKAFQAILPHLALVVSFLLAFFIVLLYNKVVKSE
ncbi:MAG: hypothetical protein ACM3WV_09675 [Bacillota bacterium]